MIEKLTEQARAAALSELSTRGWSVVDGRDAISKTFIFADFVEAFRWMTGVAIWAEKWNHHPEWCNVYKTVEVVLTTHDVGGLSPLDIKLAQKMDDLAGLDGAATRR